MLLLIVISLLYFSYISAVFNHFIYSNIYNNKYLNDFKNDNQLNNKLDVNIQSSVYSNQLKLKTGTTIVGICCKDGYILGADTRTTGGSMVINKLKRKIHSITNYTHICTAGTVADCDYIVRKAKYDLSMFQLNNEFHSNDSIFKYGFKVILSSVIRRSRQGVNSRSIESVFIIGGYDNSGPKLYSIDLHGLSNQVAYVALGSGSTKAYSLMESEFSKRHYNSDDFDNFINSNITIDEAISIVRNAVFAGIQNDLGSGSNIDFVVVTNETTKEWREIISLYSNDSNTISVVNQEIESSSLGELIVIANKSEEFIEVDRI